MKIELALAPRDPAALLSYANQVSTPGSPRYHDYIGRGQFAPLFGPTAATINSVYAALRARGLNPGAISSDHLSIPVTATAGQIESALGVTMTSYRLAGGGTGFANTNAPKLPANIASQIQAISGLDNLVRLQPPLMAPSRASSRTTRTKTPTPDERTGGPQPCRRARAKHRLNARTADQLAFAYEFSKLYRAHDFGRGQTVGIVELGQPVRTSDINGFKRCYGIHTRISYHKVDGFHSRGAGEEATLDIETVASLVPHASIIVYQGKNRTLQDANDVYRAIVDQDRARVISISFGICERLEGRRLANAATTLFLQGALQGQTFVASSGDSGSEDCLGNDGRLGELAVNFPASDPFVLGVGGTIMFHLGQPPNLGEAVWNEGSINDGAGGGGKSRFFSEPGYQRSFNISSSVREVPDVSADADPQTGYVIFFKGSWHVIGGTSASAPLWGALLTLTNTKCPGSPVGWVNPAMYFVASSAVKAVVVNDIVAVSGSPNNNDYTGDGGGHYPVLAGYDMATGLGTPRARALATSLCQASAAPRGYWLVSAGGHVYAKHAPGHGSFTHAGSRVVGIAAAHNNGYWIVTVKGRVKGFGIASKGSVRHRHAPIVGIAPDKSGRGYWLVASNGHVYAFGGARFHGSAKRVGRVVGIALDRQTGGYWIATATGRVIARDARRLGSKRLRDVTGIAGDPKRQGYWLVTASGRVHAFGVPNFGGVFVRTGRTIGIAGDPTFGGYFLATSNGHVSAINAVNHGAQAGAHIAGIAASH